MAKKKRSPEKVPARVSARRVRGRARDEAVFPVGPPRSELPDDYVETLSEIKQRIQQERLRVVLTANSAMVLLYWDLGRMILERQKRAGWGAKVIDRLAQDLREAFPEMKGFSPRNLKYMRAFSAAWPDRQFVQQLAAQIPWFHNCVLLDRIADAKTIDSSIDKEKARTEFPSSPVPFDTRPLAATQGYGAYRGTRYSL